MSARLDGLEVAETEDALVVRFRDFLSLREDNIPAIAASLLREADRLGQRTLSLDLGRVDFLTSCALGQLIRLHKKVRAGGGRLILCNVSPPVYEVFKVTRLHTLLDITPPRLSPPGQPLRVLIAEDSADVTETLHILLTLWGHETRVARNGLQALEAADTFRPHVVLLDFQMPGMNGGEVAVRLRRRPGQEKVLLVATTANGSDDPRLAPYNGLFNHYLHKPCNLERLEQLLTVCRTQVIPEAPYPRTAVAP